MFSLTLCWDGFTINIPGSFLLEFDDVLVRCWAFGSFVRLASYIQKKEKTKKAGSCRL